MTAFMVWLGALWVGWKIEEAAKVIADALREGDGE
jgi:hypothetical protein